MPIADIFVEHGHYAEKVLVQLIQELPKLDNAERIERSALVFGKLFSLLEEFKPLVQGLSDAGEDAVKLSPYDQIAEDIAKDVKASTMFHVDEPDESYLQHLRNIEHKLSTFLSPDFKSVIVKLESRLPADQVDRIIYGIESARDDASSRFGADFYLR